MTAPRTVAVDFSDAAAKVLVGTHGAFAVLLALWAVDSAAEGKVLDTVVPALLAIGAIRVFLGALWALRQPEATLVLTDDAVEVRLPILTAPLRVPNDLVHSIHLGPFEAGPRTKREAWTARRPFPSDVLHLRAPLWGSRDWAATDRLLVIAFREAIPVRPRLRVTTTGWHTLRHMPRLRSRSAHGIAILVYDRGTALRALDGDPRAPGAMPDDVRTWLS